MDHSRERRRSRADRRVFERRRKFDRRSGGFARLSTHATVESAREHIRNAIQIFQRIGTEEPPAEWSADADAAINRLTRALDDLDAGRI
ncbi:MAG TPA: hypothetical protein VH113_07740 [Gemmatimonadales bacterium]|jgi:hypothetical protein|nr:hypothetical protein [Gemmatimonadales bacterium]